MKMNVGNWWNEMEGGNRSKMKNKILPSATLVTTNPTRTDLGSHSGLADERLATNEPTHGLCED
jgi:hypothetical protein